jgi:adenylate cyclase
VRSPRKRLQSTFIGDSVMAFWGAPTEVPDQVYRACVGALRAAHRVGRLNQEWMQDGRPQMRMRIGLHCADVVVGNVGSSERLSYTVMGDGVNVASRLEGVNKIFHTTICISDSVYNAVSSPAPICRYRCPASAPAARAA